MSFDQLASSSLPGVGLRTDLVLTYDNTKMTDGAGAQLQRIYGIYSISRFLSVSYLHSPLRYVEYQGLPALEQNRADPDFHHQFNNVFHIKSDVPATSDFRPISLPDITIEKYQELVAMCDADRSDRRPYLVSLVAPYGIGDRFPDCYAVCKEISPFAVLSMSDRPLRVAVHLRRGELLVVSRDRLLPNEYYISVAQNVSRVLEALRIDYEIEIHTEVANKEFIVEPDHHGIFNRISSPAIVSPKMNGLDEFSALPNLVHCINDNAIDCLGKLATADILIMSRSSFSYVGALLNRNGIILYHPFWHPQLSSWITVDSHGQFNEVKFREAVEGFGDEVLLRNV
jgi:hypothetical protein